MAEKQLVQAGLIFASIFFLFVMVMINHKKIINFFHRIGVGTEMTQRFFQGHNPGRKQFIGK